MVLAHALPGARLLHGLTRAEAVDAAMVRGGAGAYAPLAVLLLEAFIFGIEPAAATFDDGAAA